MIKQADTVDVMSLNLADFDISPIRAFLPDQDPMEKLPRHNKFLGELAQIADELPKLLIAGKVKKTVDEFAVEFTQFTKRDNSPIEDIHYWSPRFARRVKVALDFIGQAYIWGVSLKPVDTIPEGFASLWYEVSKHLNLHPIQSYCAYCLWNWRRLDPDQPVALGNIVLLQNFLGGLDEDRFVLDHVDIEMQAGPIPNALLEAVKARFHEDISWLENQFIIIEKSLESMYQVLCLMPEGCDPYIYYERVRPYIHGWKNNPALPRGILYKGVSAYKNKYQQFRGESGAQSSIIPSLVAGLGIIHKENPLSHPLIEFRQYMPKGHREFIETLEKVNVQNSMFNFILEHKVAHSSLFDAYRQCRNALAVFREKHYEYVTSYINKQSERYKGNPTAIGTGGTPYMSSLEQLIKETRIP